MMLDPGSRPPRQLQDPRNHSYKRAMTLLFLPILFLVSCALMTGYDPTSYKTATDLKAESLILMDKAIAAPDDAQLAKIDELWVKLSKAYEYEAGKDGPNIETVKQWKLLKDPEKDLLGQSQCTPGLGTCQGFYRSAMVDSSAEETRRLCNCDR